MVEGGSWFVVGWVRKGRGAMKNSGRRATKQVY